jgi:hypothetical protein
MMKVRIPLIAVTLLLAACANEPIYNVPTHMVPGSAQALPPERIEAAIIDAGQSRGWKFERTAPGLLRAKQVQPKYSAVVDISFNARSYSIKHISSSGMNEEGGTVHPHYNMWIRNLERDIDTWLANAPLTK